MNHLVRQPKIKKNSLAFTTKPSVLSLHCSISVLAGPLLKAVFIVKVERDTLIK